MSCALAEYGGADGLGGGRPAVGISKTAGTLGWAYAGNAGWFCAVSNRNGSGAGVITDVCWLGAAGYIANIADVLGWLVV